MARPRKPPPKPERRSRGSGSVTYDAAAGAWKARLPRGHPEGRRAHYEPTREAAEAWIARELARDPTAFDPSATLGAYLDYWAGLKAPGWEPLQQIKLRAHIAACRPIAHHPLDRLRAHHIQALVAGIQARGCTARYANQIGGLVRRALRDAVKWEVLARNVAELVELPMPAPIERRAWEADEVERLLAALVGHRFEPALTLMLWGGLRFGETLALRWDALDWQTGILTVDKAERTLAHRAIGLPKRKRIREVPIPPHVVARLRDCRDARAVISPWILGNPGGGRVAPATLRRAFDALIAEAGVRRMTPHAGRHSIVSHLLAQGVPTADVSAFAGHANPAITQTSYSHSVREGRDRLRRALDGLYGGPESENGSVMWSDEGR